MGQFNQKLLLLNNNQFSTKKLKVYYILNKMGIFQDIIDVCIITVQTASNNQTKMDTFWWIWLLITF